MNLTKRKIDKFYITFKDIAQDAYLKNDLNKCIKFLCAATFTRYNFYIGYKDDEIENLMYKLSLNMNNDIVHNTVSSKRCVFYDSFSIDNSGLVQQYLGALIRNNYYIIYITEKTSFLSKESAIRSTLKNHPNSEIIVVPEIKQFERSQFIYDTIVHSKSDKVLIQTQPDSIFANIAFYALPPSIKRYKINLTDHTFWAGVGCIDYSFEFREWGAYLSNKERGLPIDHIFLAPFYPIMKRVGFQGLPKIVEGKDVILSGGSYYKIYDKDDTFFRLVKVILDACPTAILVFAGEGDRNVLSRKLKQYSLTERFIILGYRRDITELFEHCQIYLNTYPLGGGLMTQYAAQLGKPIVSYFTETTSRAEEYICQKNWIELSFNSFDKVVEMIYNLLQDKTRRINFGEAIKSCVMTPIEFDRLVDNYLNGKDLGMINLSHSIDSKTNISIVDKIEYERRNDEFSRCLFKKVGFLVLMHTPILLFNAFQSHIKKRSVRLFKRVYYRNIIYKITNRIRCKMYSR